MKPNDLQINIERTMKDINQIFDKLKNGEITHEQAHQQVLNLFAGNVSWLSPIESERQWQENSIKKIWTKYPDSAFRWQYLNGLIRMTCKYLKINVDKPRTL